MGYFFVHTTATTREGLGIVIVFEAKAETVAELADELSEAGVIDGDRLVTTDDGRGGKLIKARVPTALTLAGVKMIQPNDGNVWEPEQLARGSGKAA